MWKDTPYEHLMILVRGQRAVGDYAATISATCSFMIVPLAAKK
jgi:hypothetical protein